MQIKEGMRLGRMLLVGVLVVAPGAQGQADEGYRGVGVAQAGEITYPVNSRSAGMVTLDVSVDASGAVQKIKVVRDMAPFTSAAESGLKSWKFTPAMADGQPTAAKARISVVFNPFNPGNVSLPNPPVPKPENVGGMNGVFQPADVKTGQYAVYPANSVAFGTVVLDVKVGADGSVAGIKALRGTGALADAATKAVQGWVFVPAKYGGRAVKSRAVVAFVFVMPGVGTM